MTTPPDWDIELRELRATASAAGITALIRPRDVGIVLETAEEILARAGLTDELEQRRRWRRPVLAASAAVAASVLVASVLQPWGTPRVEAATPEILDYQFAMSEKIVSAAGRDPAKALAALSDSAARNSSPIAPGSTQHVVTDNWYAEVDSNDADGTSVLVPQTTETWIGADGSLRLVERRGDPLAPDGRGLPLEGAWDDQPATADETQPAGALDPALVDSLPRDPDDLSTLR